MCGIFGSTEFKHFEKLYLANRERGDFAHGFMYAKRNGETYVCKGEGTTEMTGDYAFNYDSQYDMFFGHTQAPTSSHRYFKPCTSHPFDHGNFVVAHNGVLENHMDLARDHRIDTNMINVDSQIIPMLMDDLYVGSDVLAIKEACNMLKGIYACWIFCKETKLTYLVRSGCTLYTDDDKNSFSSIKAGDVKHELDSDVIYCLTPEGLTPVGEFKSDNPFFVL